MVISNSLVVSFALAAGSLSLSHAGPMHTTKDKTSTVEKGKKDTFVYKSVHAMINATTKNGDVNQDFPMQEQKERNDYLVIVRGWNEEDPAQTPKYKLYSYSIPTEDTADVRVTPIPPKDFKINPVDQQGSLHIDVRLGNRQGQLVLPMHKNAWDKPDKYPVTWNGKKVGFKFPMTDETNQYLLDMAEEADTALAIAPAPQKASTNSCNNFVYQNLRFVVKNMPHNNKGPLTNDKDYLIAISGKTLGCSDDDYDPRNHFRFYILRETGPVTRIPNNGIHDIEMVRDGGSMTVDMTIFGERGKLTIGNNVSENFTNPSRGGKVTWNMEDLRRVEVAPENRDRVLSNLEKYDPTLLIEEPSVLQKRPSKKRRP